MGKQLEMRPDYNALKNPEQVDHELEVYTGHLMRTLRKQRSVESEFDRVKGEYRDELKGIGAELDHYLGVLDELESRRRRVIDEYKQAPLPFVQAEGEAEPDGLEPDQEQPADEYPENEPEHIEGEVDDGTLPFTDEELELLAAGENVAAAKSYAERNGVEPEIATAEVQAWRAANSQSPEEQLAELEPDQEQPARRRKRTSVVP
jgi:hypothetical protein